MLRHSQVKGKLKRSPVSTGCTSSLTAGKEGRVWPKGGWEADPPWGAGELSDPQQEGGQTTGEVLSVPPYPLASPSPAASSLTEYAARAQHPPPELSPVTPVLTLALLRSWALLGDLGAQMPKHQGLSHQQGPSRLHGLQQYVPMAL